MRRADRQGNSLYINLGRPELAARRRREMMAMVAEGGRFKEVETLWGLEPAASCIGTGARP